MRTWTPAVLAQSEQVASTLRRAGLLVNILSTRCMDKSVEVFLVTDLGRANAALRQAGIPPLAHPLSLREASGSPPLSPTLGASMALVPPVPALLPARVQAALLRAKQLVRMETHRGSTTFVVRNQNLAMAALAKAKITLPPGGAVRVRQVVHGSPDRAEATPMSGLLYALGTVGVLAIGGLWARRGHAYA